MKTHAAWTYRVLGPGVFEWTSPHGHRYLRDRTGTSALDGDTTDPPQPPERP